MFYQALQELEQQYQSAQIQLEDKIRSFEEERDAELEKIEYEKYKLQELENQERLGFVFFCFLRGGG